MEHQVTVLFPMVTTLDELLAARRLLAEAAAEVGAPVGDLPTGFEVGVMIEVPALALVARLVAPHVDLFSIGTNDLAQYTLAAERGNAAVGHLADPLHPAVLRLIAGISEAAGPACGWRCAARSGASRRRPRSSSGWACTSSA